MPPEFLAVWQAELPAAVDRVVPLLELRFSYPPDQDTVAGRPVYRLPGGVADADLPAFLTRFLAAVTAYADTGEVRQLTSACRDRVDRSGRRLLRRPR